MPDQLWRVDPPDCFTPVDGRDAEGQPRRFNLLDRVGRIEAYAWLLQHDDEEHLFKHLDAVLLVDAWPEVGPSLRPELRRLWDQLVYAASDAVIDQLLIAGLQAGRPEQLGRRAREHLIERLAERGLTAEEIRQLLRHRGTPG